MEVSTTSTLRFITVTLCVPSACRVKAFGFLPRLGSGLRPFFLLIAAFPLSAWAPLVFLVNFLFFWSVSSITRIFKK